jgi:hypothetical protein
MLQVLLVHPKSDLPSQSWHDRNDAGTITSASVAKGVKKLNSGRDFDPRLEPGTWKRMVAKNFLCAIGTEPGGPGKSKSLGGKIPGDAKQLGTGLSTSSLKN